MEAQATTATANVHLQAPRQVPSQQQPQQHRSSTSPPPSAANAAALSSGTAATSKSASTRSNSIASSTGWTHNSLSPSGRGGHDSHGHTLSPSSSHSGVAAAFAESCSSIQAGGSGGSSCCTAGGAVTRSMDGMTPSAAGVRSTANAQTDQLSFKEANASLANVLSLADNLSADPGSLSHTDPSSDLLVKALSDEASRRGADGEQGHGNWREREQEEDQQQPSRSSLHQHQHHLPIAMSQAVKLSPKASLKAEAAPAALADTASEAPEPSWSRPSSGPASAYTSPAAKNLPLHSHPEGLQVHGHAGLSPPSGLSTTRLSAKGYLMDTATAASGSPHAYHRAMTQQATVALGHSCDVAVSSSPPAGPAAPSIGLLGFPSALGRFGSVPHSTSASAANSASASASGTPDRKLTPSQSGRSTPSLSAASVSTTAQMQQQQHLIASPRPQLVLETHHLQLQTHKPSGRRMINQYIIEDELGRGVHGKVRMAWDTETGERVAVKIVERQSRKRLGGGGQEWSARIAAKQRAATAVATTTAPAQMHKDDATSAASSSASPSSPQTGSMGGAPGDKGKARDNEVDPIHAHVQRLRVGGTDSGEHASGGEDSADTTVPRRAHFALSPPRSPGAAAAARFGPLEHGLPTREEMAEHEALRKEKAEREKARKALLWTTDKKVKREIAIMKKCQHENIVRLREVIDDPQSKKIFMVLEYMAGGEVQWKDEQGRPTLTVDEARRTFRDVVLGLEYLHYQGIIHRDIKPANLLWNEEKHVKISDFGVSHYSYALLVASGGLPSSGSGETNDPSLTDDRELAKTAGSPAFFAPELCLAGEAPLTSSSLKERGGNSTSTISPSHDPVHSGFPFNNGPSSGGATAASAPAPRGPKITKAIDVWALGVTLYCLLFGELPFTAPSEFALFNVIPNDDYKLPVYMGADNVRVGPRKPREDARQLRDLIDRLLEKDPEQRIKLEAVKKHPWVTRGLHDAPAWLIATAPE
ncbi:kinase-like protein, partial [Tilletiaria anomala UBC 951]